MLALEVQVLALGDHVEVRAHEWDAHRLRPVLLRLAEVKARVARGGRLHALVHAPPLRAIGGVDDRRDRRARQEVARAAVLPAVYLMTDYHTGRGGGWDDVQPRPESRFGIDVNRQRRVIPRLALEARGARLGERVEVRRHGGRAETRAGESRRGRLDRNPPPGWGASRTRVARRIDEISRSSGSFETLFHVSVASRRAHSCTTRKNQPSKAATTTRTRLLRSTYFKVDYA